MTITDTVSGEIEATSSPGPRPSTWIGASKDVVPGWSYLPFQTYANSIYGDTVGQAYATKGDLNKGLAAWQDASAEYGTEQGFTVSTD